MIACVFLHPLFAAEAPVGAGTPALAQIQGKVTLADPKANVLRIIDATDKTWTVYINSTTRIQNGENKDMKLADLQENDKVDIYYDTRNFSARQIDRLSGLGKAALGQE